MKIEIQSLHFDADKKLLQFVNEKITKIEHYYDAIIGVEVTLKLEKSSDAENKLAEIKATIPGHELFAKRNAKSFEEAVDSALEAVIAQAKKQKSRLKE
jgi:putative sigma-54 modulation protein